MSQSYSIPQVPGYAPQSLKRYPISSINGFPSYPSRYQSSYFSTPRYSSISQFYSAGLKSQSTVYR